MSETFFREGEIAGILKDCANATLVFGGTTLRVVADRADEEFLQGQAASLIGKAIVVTIKTGSLPGLAIGSAITVDGTAFKVRNLLQEGDGALTKVLCAID